jgi:hypothetical protein
MQQTVFPISMHLVNLFYMCLNECMQALNMDAIIQSIFRFAAVASPGETMRLLATVSTLMGQQMYNLPSSMGAPSWRIINISSKFGTIVFKVSWLQFRVLLLTLVKLWHGHSMMSVMNQKELEIHRFETLPFITCVFRSTLLRSALLFRLLVLFCCSTDC